MGQQKRLRGLLVLVVATVILFFLATGLSGLELLPGEDLFLEGAAEGESADVDMPELAPFLGLDERWQRVIGVTMLILLVLSVIGLFVSKQVRRRFLVYVIYALWVYATFYLIIRGVRQCNLVPDLPYQPVSAPEVGPLPPEATSVGDPPGWLSFLMGVVLLSLLAAAAWFVWRRLHRPADDTVELLALEARETLQALQAGGDLKDAVMRCYFEMAQILQRQRGLTRNQAATPREFEQQLASAGLPAKYVQRLTRLFERVRYGAKQPGEGEEQEAIACLRAIVRFVGRRA